MKKLTIDDIKTPDWGIDDMPNLRKSLGKAGSDKIRIHTLPEAPIGSVRTRKVHNPHQAYMQDLKPHAGGPVDDILAGIASLGEGSQGSLSASRLHNLLQSTDTFSTDFIMAGLSLDKRQAQRYLAALKLCIKHISNHRSKTND